MKFFSLITAIISFFRGKGSPATQKKREIKALENELKAIEPCIYKNGMLTVQFANYVYMLQKLCKGSLKILSETICTKDKKSNDQFINQLLLTGFGADIQSKIARLGYGFRKQEILDVDENHRTSVYARQRMLHEQIVKQLNSEEFTKIDGVIANLLQLYDICNFNYGSILQVFDVNYNSYDENYTPVFANNHISAFSECLLDLYYLTKGFIITGAMSRALIALAQMKDKASVTDAFKEKLDEDLRKINSLIKNIISAGLLYKLICVAKNSTEIPNKTVEYKSEHRKRLAEERTKVFNADEDRIKTEIRDETILADIKKLFGSDPLIELNGYNIDTNKKLEANQVSTFLWIKPLMVLKTFLHIYLSQGIKTYLEDLIIEGFFNNPVYEAKFAECVYECFQWSSHILAFESTFEASGDNSLAYINGLINDSRSDPDFLKQLSKLVDNVNNKAQHLVQTCSQSLYTLTKLIEDVVGDAKKAKPDNISNIRVIMNSARNAESSVLLDKQLESWQILISVMRNYAVLGEIDKESRDKNISKT